VISRPAARLHKYYVFSGNVFRRFTFVQYEHHDVYAVLRLRMFYRYPRAARFYAVYYYRVIRRFYGDGIVPRREAEIFQISLISPLQGRHYVPFRSQLHFYNIIG